MSFILKSINSLPSQFQKVSYTSEELESKSLSIFLKIFGINMAICSCGALYHQKYLNSFISFISAYEFCVIGNNIHENNIFNITGVFKGIYSNQIMLKGTLTEIFYKRFRRLF